MFDFRPHPKTAFNLPSSQPPSPGADEVGVVAAEAQAVARQAAGGVVHAHNLGLALGARHVLVLSHSQLLVHQLHVRKEVLQTAMTRQNC